MIARIAVAAAVYAIDKPYTYRIPAGMQLTPGMRVQLPFGNGNRRTEGVVLTVEEGSGEDCKPVDAVLDAGPVLSEQMLRLAAFVRERYFCTFYDAIRAMLPAGLWFSARQVYTLSQPLPADWEAMTRRKPEAQAVVRALLALGGSAGEAVLRAQFPDEGQLREQLRYLAGKKLLQTQTKLSRKAADKLTQFVELAVPAAQAMEYGQSHRRAAPLQHAVLQLLSTIGSGCAKDVCYFTGASIATLRRLEKLGLVRFTAQEVLRRAEIRPAQLKGPLVLNAGQQRVFEQLLQQAAQPKPGVALLYGVTGSGKTSVYIKLIAACLEAGRQAILMVPEIALTPQLLSLLAAHFGDRVAVLHSSLRMTERYDEWKRIRSGAAGVVVGTRSAVFAPVARLGLVIVDEEQEHTYKSENSPCYHAREVAIYRGAREGAMVLLGSATPSVESMYRARTGSYGLYTLTQRYNGMALPQVVIADMKQEIRAGNAGSISRPLLERMLAVHERGQQTILFLNRRGTSRMAVCVDCGFVPQCPRCSVHLTYHAANHRRMCHYCGYSEPAGAVCPACGGHMKYVGAGTQRVEQELQQLAPELTALRMDADSISAANPHEKLLRRFQEEKIPVLIGTQMVTKGLNFDSVTLVGVLDADLALYVDHFRAAETAFSMMTQVIGRAGRASAAGTAVIQTMTPDNLVIQQAAKQDYDSFYETEIALRELRGCPPFADLITLTFFGLEEQQVYACAYAMRERLAQRLEAGACPGLTVRLLGPAPAAVAKVNNRYRCCLTLCARNCRALRELAAGALREFSRDRKNKGVFVSADVNGYG